MSSRKRRGDGKITLGAVVLATAALLAGVTSIDAQPQPPSKSQGEAAPAKPLKFEVVSIHPDKNGDDPRTCHQRIGAATPDGYSMKCMFMVVPIVQAYSSQKSGGSTVDTSHLKFVGFPAWLVMDQYDIDARVAPEDLKDWQNPALRPTMLRAMLRSMLADRLKLVVHRGSEVQPVYLLEVAKGGPKFKATVAGEPHAASPYQMQLPGGGENVMVRQDGEIIQHEYGISMAQLARNFPDYGGRAVLDKTGLKGRYDITYEEPAPELPASQGQPHAPAPDIMRSAFSIAHSLGLKLVAAKQPIPTLVCDHVERPTPN